MQEGKRQNMACDALTRAAAKAKRQGCTQRWLRVFLPFAFCLLPFAFPCMAQNSVATPSVATWSFNYKFENKRFYVPIMEIDLAADGSGEVQFQRGESDDVLDHKFKLLPATMSRIHQLFEVTRL